MGSLSLMRWNWQQADWPNSTWDESRLALAEERFLFAGGQLLGTVKHLGSEDRDQITVEAMSNEAVTTSEIEGEVLNRDSVQSSIRRQLGLVTDPRGVKPAEVEFVLDKARLLDRCRKQLSARQIKVLLRVLREGPDGFKGGLSAGNYAAICKTSPATATRDLAEMVERGALTRSGGKRHTRYHLPIPLRSTPWITIDARGDIIATERRKRS